MFRVIACLSLCLAGLVLLAACDSGSGSGSAGQTNTDCVLGSSQLDNCKLK